MRGFYRHRNTFGGSPWLRPSVHQSIRIGGGDFSKSRLYVGSCVIVSRHRSQGDRGWRYNLHLYVAKLRIQIGGR